MYLDNAKVPVPKNRARRTFGVLLALLPLFLPLASLAVSMARDQEARTTAIVVMVLAATVASLNFFLSFVRPVLLSLRRGGMGNYRRISGIPIIGTILLCTGALLGFGSPEIALAGIIVFLLDTGGSGWLVFATWNDSSLWDR